MQTSFRPPVFVRLIPAALVLMACLAITTATASAAYKPDLRVTGLKLNTTTSERAGYISVKTTVSNTGPAMAPRSRAGVYLSLDRRRSANDLALLPNWKLSLWAHETRWKTQSFKVPTAAAANGYYYIVACADIRKAIRENSEANNCRATTKRVHILPLPTLSIDDVSLVEGDTGTTMLVFTVTQNRKAKVTSIVSYQTSDGTAGDVNDYGESHGSVGVVPGALTATMNVPLVGDTDDEANETFTMTLSSPSNALVADAAGTGTVTDDDLLELRFATEINNTQVDFEFNGAVDPLSIDANGSDFTFDGGLVASAAAIDGLDSKIVHVTTGMQVNAQPYIGTAAGLLGLFGDGVDPAVDSDGFTGI